MAPSHDPANPRKQGPTPTRRRNDTYATVQQSAAIHRRRLQSCNIGILRSDLLSTPIPGLEDDSMSITQVSPIAPAIEHGHVAPSTMLPHYMTHSEHPTFFAQHMTGVPVTAGAAASIDTSSHLGPQNARGTVSPAYMYASEGTVGQYGFPNQLNQWRSNNVVSSQQLAASEGRPYDYSDYVNLLNPSTNSGDSPTLPRLTIQGEGQRKRSFMHDTVTCQRSTTPKQLQSAVQLYSPTPPYHRNGAWGDFDASMYHDPWREGHDIEQSVIRAPAPPQTWQRPSSGGSERSWQSEDMDISSDDDRREGPVGALSISDPTGGAQIPASNGQEHVVSPGDLNSTGSSLPHGEPRVPFPTYISTSQSQSSAHVDRLLSLFSEKTPEPSAPNPSATVGAYNDSHGKGNVIQLHPIIDLEGAPDRGCNPDHDIELQDDLYGSGDGEDPHARLSMLERQSGQLRMELEESHRKIDATDRKIDLLCEMVSRLDRAREASGTTTSARESHVSSPSPSAALVVVGSRSVPTERQKILRNRRQPADLRIQKAIDGHWDKLMLTYEPPEEALVKGYKLENGRACNPNRFQPDHREFVKSSWNTSVVEVFIESLFASNHPDLPAPPNAAMRDTVLRLAFSQLKTWRLKMHEDKERELTKMKTKRRYERRRQSYLRRRNAAAAYAETHRHLDMVTYLDVEGMSSDESDHESSQGIPKYRINAKTWRHPRAEGCLRVLDALHRYDGFQDSYIAGPGARVHLRVAGGAESKRRPKKGLPRCLYNPDLLVQPGAERLNAVPSAGYDFGHVPEIIDMAKPKNGDASSLGPFPEM